jgi:hypothetical protein
LPGYQRHPLAPEFERGEQAQEFVEILAGGSLQADDHLVAVKVEIVRGAGVVDEQALVLIGDRRCNGG